MNEQERDKTIDKLLRQQFALAEFGSFAFRETDLQKILNEAARACAGSLDVPFAKICRHRELESDLIVEAGFGWKGGVIGTVVSAIDEGSTQGRAFVTGEPVILEDLTKNNSYTLPSFYNDNAILATADVLIKGSGKPWGVLEVDSPIAREFDEHDIQFLTGFANVIAEAVATATRLALLSKNIKEMEALISEKDVLAEELQHRVRNNLQLVFGMLTRQMEMKDASNEGVRAIAQRVLGLAAIYDHLLGNGLSRTIDFDRYLRSLCASVRAFQDIRDLNVALSFDREPEPLFLDLDTVTALGIVITEIISNAYAHAFIKRRGEIHVMLTRDNGNATVVIKDDGVGFVEPTTSKRHGLGLVRRLIEQIEGTVQVASDQGTTWTFIFPISEPADGPLQTPATQ